MLKKFIVCNGSTIGELQEEINKKIINEYGANGNMQCGSFFTYEISPYGEIQFLNNKFVMCFIVNQKAKI